MSIEDLNKKAVKEAEEGNFENAVRIFNSVIELDPEQWEPYFNRGMAWFRQEKYDMAIVDFSSALKLDPENAAVFSQRGVAWHLSGNNELAKQDLEKALQLEPENEYRYSSLAYLKDRMGDVHGAIEFYKKAIEIDPENAISHNNLGLLEQKLGYMKKSEIHFKEADELAKKYFGDDFSQEPAAKEKIEITADSDSLNADIPSEKEKAVPLTIKHIFATTIAIFTSGKSFREFISYTGSSIRRMLKF